MKPNHLSSIEKALIILRAFTPQNHEMGTLELSRKLDMHKSTVSRLLSSCSKTRRPKSTGWEERRQKSATL